MVFYDVKNMYFISSTSIYCAHVYSVGWNVFSSMSHKNTVMVGIPFICVLMYVYIYINNAFKWISVKEREREREFNIVLQVPQW